MTRIDSATRQMNFVNSFCTRKLSDDDLRLFNVKEGKVRIIDRIADFFSKKNLTESDFFAKREALRKLSSKITLSPHEKGIADGNLYRLLQLSSSGPVYEGF